VWNDVLVKRIWRCLHKRLPDRLAVNRSELELAPQIARPMLPERIELAAGAGDAARIHQKPKGELL